MTRIATIIAMLASTLIAAVAPAGAAADYHPAFVEERCDAAGIDPALLGHVRCGTVAVPRMSERPEAGVFRLRVVQIKSATRPERRDAMVLLTGGPGGATLPPPAYGLIAGDFADQNILLVNLRAIADSEPKMCDGKSMFEVVAPGRGSGATAGQAASLSVFRACLDEAWRQGYRPEEFGSAADAEDLERIRQAMGYDQLNLLATSYGAVTGLELASRHPASVRSLVLNSPYIGAHALLSGPASWRRAWLAIVAECAGSPSCATTYPDLATERERVSRQLKRKPLSIPMPPEFGAPGNVAKVGSRDFETQLFGLSYSVATLGHIPATVRAFAEGDKPFIAKLLMDPANMGPLHSVSLFSMLATLCSDGIAAHDSALVAPEDKGAEFSGIAGIFEICGNWARKVSTPAIPTNTDVPMITLTGLLDPITPPDNARRIAAAIGPGVRQFEFASIGHAAVPSSACALAITKLFFTNPSQPLRPDCLAADPPIQFAPPPDEAGGAVR